MIQSNELRIGNYVLYDKKNVFIAELRNEGATVYDGFGFEKNVPYGMLQPVELNDNLICNFGFDKYILEDMYYFEKPTMQVNFVIKNHGAGYIRASSSFRDPEVKLHSLHQLQNLYFATFGTELQYGVQVGDKVSLYQGEELFRTGVLVMHNNQLAILADEFTTPLNLFISKDFVIRKEQ